MRFLLHYAEKSTALLLFFDLIICDEDLCALRKVKVTFRPFSIQVETF